MKVNIIKQNARLPTSPVVVHCRRLLPRHRVQQHQHGNKHSKRQQQEKHSQPFLHGGTETCTELRETDNSANI